MSPFRAPADVLLGCYPLFAVGGPISRKILPVFHFHEVSPSYLEPHLLYLKENGYRCASVEELLSMVGRGETLPPKTVLLTFDDCWTSLWTVAAPLLRRYEMNAVAFAIPGRVSGESGVRSTVEDDPAMEDFGDRGPEPFCRWDELKALDAEGVVEVESHTFAHEQIPVAGELLGVWSADDCRDTPLLSKPLVWKKGDPESFRPYDEREIGKPRPLTRARMSDGRAVRPEGEETLEEQRKAIRRDLDLCRIKMETVFNRSARILCFPWAVAGSIAREEVRSAGYQAAFSDSFAGKRFVGRGSESFRLMRLKHNWIFHLPGKGRRRLPSL